MVANREGKWDEDGVNGSESSMELLLKWLRSGGNTERWRISAHKHLRSTMVREIHDFLVYHGIKHRTMRGIECKLWQLGKQVTEADDWLTSKGLRRVDSNKKVRGMVLQLCPDYFNVAPLLRSARTRIRTSPHIYNCGVRRTESKKQRVENAVGRTGKVVANAGSKRAAGIDNVGRRPTSKRVRVRRHVGYEVDAEKMIRHTGVPTRQVFVPLDLQEKRDQANKVRVKIRRELLDLGISLDDVNKLLPL